VQALAVVAILYFARFDPSFLSLRAKQVMDKAAIPMLTFVNTVIQVCENCVRQVCVNTVMQGCVDTVIYVRVNIVMQGCVSIVIYVCVLCMCECVCEYRDAGVCKYCDLCVCENRNAWCVSTVMQACEYGDPGLCEPCKLVKKHIDSDV
jgi:hypothetical protein